MIGALEVAQLLHENGVVTRHPLEIVSFTDEEGATVGSRVMTSKVEAEAREVAKSRRTPITFNETESAVALGLSHKSMPSGAGHDSQEMTRIAPTGMIFVPSVGGISHAPKEFTSPQDMANGVNVLRRTVLEVDRGALKN